jgi:septal ring factor EnvC (AmiA/AmiB activator)
MTTKSLILLSFLVVSTSFFAQDNSNSIENQFINVVDKSNNYQEFKVIKKSKINELRENVLDSISALEAKIETSQTEIARQKAKIETLTENLNTTQSNLASSIEKEDGIEILGVLTKKATYNTILWSIILGLIAILGLLFYKFRNSHAVTKAVKLKFDEIESEFEAHRRKTLENEQQIRRKLQDEINKNRNV